MLRSHLLLLAVATLLGIGACTSPKPVETSEERPSADKVAKAASAKTAETETDKLVLYSSSMEKAELETGADVDEAPAEDEGARAGEGVEEEAIPEPVELAVSADKTYVLAGETFSEIPALIGALEKRHFERPTESVRIVAAAGASDEAIIDVVTAARRAGFTRLELEVAGQEPTETPEAPSDTPTEEPTEEPTQTEPQTP